MFGWSEKSTYHKTCVDRVNRYLESRFYGLNKEKGLIGERTADAWGYDKTTNAWYLCDVKVTSTYLQKSVYQIHDTALRFKQMNNYDNVVPVLAFPDKLRKTLVDKENWDCLHDACDKTGVTIWIIEELTSRRIQGLDLEPGSKSRAANCPL